MSTAEQATPVIDDKEIRTQIWNGYIPVVFQLASHEVTSLTSPFPYYLMVPRQGYLTLYIDEVQKYFESFTATIGKTFENVWFEYEDIPLKWHLPVGVLFDSIFLKQASIELPWRITVHFQTFPMDKLLRFSNDNDIQFNYINAVKQASQVKYGSTKTVMTLRKEDQAALWNAIRDCNLNDFEKIKASTFDQSPAKAFPIRVLYGNEKKAQSSLFVINNDETATLSQFLETVLGGTQEKASKVVVQGVQPSADTPIKWLAENCCHPDFFLYICVHNE